MHVWTKEAKGQADKKLRSVQLNGGVFEDGKAGLLVWTFGRMSEKETIPISNDE